MEELLQKTWDLIKHLFGTLKKHEQTVLPKLLLIFVLLESNVLIEYYENKYI